MEEIIKNLLKDLEKKYNITILFAAETGSRNWGYNTEESDYDIHFVFYRHLKEYISLNKMPNKIVIGYDENLNERKKEGSFIEMSGFDIFKYSQLLLNSNLSTIEWINASKIYLGDNNVELRTYINNNFNKKSVVFQYITCFKLSYKEHIKGNEITYKKYLHTIRNMLNAEYVIKYNKLPPNLMTQTLDELKNDISPEVYHKIKELIGIILQKRGKDKVKEIPVLDKYYEYVTNKLEHFSCEGKEKNVNVFNKFLQDLLIKNEK